MEPVTKRTGKHWMEIDPDRTITWNGIMSTIGFIVFFFVVITLIHKGYIAH